MQTLINDLLNYSRLITRGEPFVLVDCSAILKQVLANLQLVIAESNAIITYDTLPQVMADATQLTQVFQNLIANAIKFCQNQQPRIHIGMGSREWGVGSRGVGSRGSRGRKYYLISLIPPTPHPKRIFVLSA